MNDTATPPTARVPLAQLAKAGANRITAALHRALPAEQRREPSGGFNSAI